jgi:hypothetical protein
LYGKDYAGRVCGQDGRGGDLYYPRIAADLIKFALDNAGKTPNQINPLDVRARALCWATCIDRRLCRARGVCVALLSPLRPPPLRRTVDFADQLARSVRGWMPDHWFGCVHGQWHKFA